MVWLIEFCDEFDAEFPLLAEAVRVEMLATLKFLKADGPLTSRPAVDTLKGSAYANMKELRFDADNECGEWQSLLILHGKPFFSAQVTKLRRTKPDFTEN